MLALTHHLVVQYAASVASGRFLTSWFEDYCVLGDDIVIWDERVAKAYRAAMLELGVTISASKSLSSPKGVFEFAKRFVVAGEDVTPLPLSAIAASSQNLAVLAELLRTLPQRSLAVVMRFLGFGYRVLGSLQAIVDSNARRSFAAFWALQPGLVRESPDTWSSWFVTKGPGRGYASDPKWFEIIASLSEWVTTQKPKMPAEIPFYFQRAYLAELEGAVGSKDSMFPDQPFGEWREIEVALASLFHGHYSRLFTENRQMCRELDALFDRLPLPIGPHGVDVLMRSLREIVPTSTLLSTGGSQSLGWREASDPNRVSPVSVASFIRLRMRVRPLLGEGTTSVLISEPHRLGDFGVLLNNLRVIEDQRAYDLWGKQNLEFIFGERDGG